MTTLKVDLDAPLIFEYVYLPITDLSVKFLYRFKGPIETAWTNTLFKYSQNTAMKDFALQTWAGYLDAEPASSAKEAFKRSDVTLIECHITPK